VPVNAIAISFAAGGHLSHIQTFARWLVDEHHIQSLAPLKLRHAKPRELEIPTTAELATLLRPMRDSHTSPSRRDAIPPPRTSMSPAKHKIN
jgi:hypothetical protein